MEACKACLLVFGLILVVAVQSGLSVKCYVCNSGAKYQAQDCRDATRLVKTNYLKDCAEEEIRDRMPNGTYIKCRVFTQNVMGEDRLIRQCASGGKSNCIERTGTKGIKLTYCHCDGDGCNSGTTLYAPITMVIGIIMAIWITVQRT